MRNRPHAKPRCDSREPDHYPSRCKVCLRLYQREYRRMRRIRERRALGPFCAFCGISRGNEFGVKVYRYALIRPVRIRANFHTNKCIASIPICDDCVQEHAQPSRSYMLAHGLTEPVWPSRRAA